MLTLATCLWGKGRAQGQQQQGACAFGGPQPQPMLGQPQKAFKASRTGSQRQQRCRKLRLQEHKEQQMGVHVLPRGVQRRHGG